MRLQGRVVCFYDDRAFGFVMTDERKTYFLHVRHIHGGFVPQKGDVVTFEVGPAHRAGLAAEALDAEIVSTKAVL
jgi:cold shock CspA family protein